jgi:hypothetical protein
VWESVFSTQSKNILAFIGFLSPHALWRTGYIYTYTSLEFRTEVVNSSYPIKRRKRERKREREKRTKYNKASIFMHDWPRSIGRREPYMVFKPIETFGKGQPGYQSIRQL